MHIIAYLFQRKQLCHTICTFASIAFLLSDVVSNKITSGGTTYMEFEEDIKKLRKEQNLTQEQFAEKLSISRQAVSNWENNRNLPDIEMLIQISTVFGVSLDQLILGGTHMNNMTEKLIKDTSETRRAKMNLVSTIIGTALMIMGFTCFIIKALSTEYVDETGLLHEHFFLLPIGLLFLLCGAVVILFTGVVFLIKKRKSKN
jgi:transcriptional regulator with XRE-family HTH domain